MKTIVSALRRAKPISWVTSTIVMPSRASLSSTRTTSPISSGSSGDLVEQHQPRFHRERAGNRDALLLAAGELLRISRGLVFEIDHTQDLAGELARRGKRHALGRGRAQRDVPLDAEMGEEIVALEDDADLATQCLEPPRRRLERFAVELDGAAFRPFQPVDAAQQGALSRAAASDNRHDLAGFDRERYLGERLMHAKALRNVV